MVTEWVNGALEGVRLAVGRLPVAEVTAAVAAVTAARLLWDGVALARRWLRPPVAVAVATPPAPPPPPPSVAEEVQELLYAIEHGPAAATRTPHGTVALYLTTSAVSVTPGGTVYYGSEAVYGLVTEPHELLLVQAAVEERLEALERERLETVCRRLSSTRAELQSKQPTYADLGEGDE